MCVFASMQELEMCFSSVFKWSYHFQHLKNTINCFIFNGQLDVLVLLFIATFFSLLSGGRDVLNLKSAFCFL